MHSPTMLLVVTGWNCADKVLPCFKSLMNLSYDNWSAVLISDGSTDNTAFALKNLPSDPRIHIERHSSNKGATYRRHMAIQNYTDDPETVICFLGLDDELFPEALQEVAEAYEGDNWMTYGQWIDHRGRINSMALYFDEETHKLNKYRTQKYRSTAMNTFKRFLYDEIRIEDLKDLEGNWFQVCTEGPVMFACLEMCGPDHIGIIHNPIYMYNIRLPGGTLNRFGKAHKYDVYDRIIAQQPYKRLTR